MPWIADLHIHSHFSIATSKELVPEHLDYQARRKGIRLVGTGDATHPGWLTELEEKLQPTDGNLYRLKDEFRLDRPLPAGANPEDHPRFMITAEVSTIYKYGERVRKVHHLILLSGIDAARKLQHRLTARGGNITSDGRPILGMDSRDLLEIVLEADPRGLFIPAHIWTPWFSALGSRSGFDTVAECYRDLAHHIHAVETGLSTDPPMHWVCRHLDGYTLVSNSDAHSPDRLGRNAILLDAPCAFTAVVESIRSGDPASFGGTIDLFPQEGKYHFDGHRKCGVCWNPLETLAHDGICAKCGRPVTEGVLNRVAQLADRDDPLQRPERRPFHCIIPLREILAELCGTGPASKTVTTHLEKVLSRVGPEMHVLLWKDTEIIRAAGFPELAEGITRMRRRRVHVQEGFDGQYGRVRIFEPGEKHAAEPSLFPVGKPPGPPMSPRPLLSFSMAEYRHQAEAVPGPETEVSGDTDSTGLNPGQKAAVHHDHGPALVLAGPGSGKTRVLAERIARLVRERISPPESILALTFARRAARSMAARIRDLGCENRDPGPVVAATFHGLADRLLREFPEAAGRSPDYFILNPQDRLWLLRHELGLDKEAASMQAERIGSACLDPEANPETLDGPAQDYSTLLKRLNALDVGELPHRLLRSWRERPHFLAECRRRFQWIMVDEYQDVNPLQYALIRALVPDSAANLMVIGDPDQAIYSFRGADVRFIQSFREDYPEAAVFDLAISYRCTENILQASAQVVRGDREAAALQAGPARGVKLDISEHGSERGEAEFIARTIEEMSGGLRFFSMDSAISDGTGAEGISGPGDFAVLCRTRHLMAPLRKAFGDHAIPFQEVDTTPFFREQPTLGVLDLLNLGVDPTAPLPRGRLNAEPRFKNIPETRIAAAAALPPAEALERLWKMWIPEGHEEIRLRLLDLAGNFSGNCRDFLLYLARGVGEDTFRPGEHAVALMTMHAAKGLEFPVVFLPALERGILPFSLYPGREADPEEERRLLYVGMTRASRRLFLSHARRRALDGRVREQSPSPFLNNLDRNLARWIHPDPAPKPHEPEQKKLFKI